MNTRIIIPTRNEAGNIRKLVSEIGDLKDYGSTVQIYFVDDSDTLETVEAIKAAQEEFPWLTIDFLYREGDQRVGRIVGAVKAGLQGAQREGIESIVVMDGDGQHDPIYIPAMLEELRGGSNLVSGSRYIRGGSREGLDGTFRVFASRGATFAAKSLFPGQLQYSSDPMSGFFAVALSKIKVNAIEADGFKVLLEILLTNPGLTISEIPVVFRNRNSGESKVDPAVAAKYLSQLIRRRRQTPLGGFSKERKLQLENV